MGNHLLAEALAIADIETRDLNVNVSVPNSNILKSMKIFYLLYHFHL